VEIKILQSALKHGISEEGILQCLDKYRGCSMFISEIVGGKAEKYMTAGFDNEGRPIEVAWIDENGKYTVIHAMKLRKQYRNLLEGVNYGI